MTAEASIPQSVETHVLIVNLGRGNRQLPPPHYERTTYVMADGKNVGSCVAGLALWWWLRESGHAPQAVLFACTDAAWEDKEAAVRAEAERLGLPWELHEVERHEVPRRPEQLWAVLPQLERWLQRHGASRERSLTLHIDLTHAFRAIPMAHSWLALYLERRGLVRRGVWGYGAYDPNQKDLTPYLDLSHFADLADWAEAVRAFRERLDTATVGRLIDPLEKAARRQRAQAGQQPQGHLRAAISAAKEAGPFLRAGLPLEVGLSVRQRLGATTAFDAEQAAARLLPPFASLARDLVSVLDGFALPSVASRDPKRNHVLDHDEIRRQRRLVVAWLEAGMVDAALRALRELVINRVLLAWGESQDWLPIPTRKRAENRLRGLASTPPPRPLSEDEKRLRDLWNKITNRRNPLAHAGMRPEPVDVGGASQALRDELLPAFDHLDGVEDVWQLRDTPEVAGVEDE
ncbi:MAG: hypothetical protein HRF46_03480 [Acidobacteriota bacterium]|jgi:hypothetical protein